MENTPCIIVDLEGTLTDCSHRIHHYNNKEYDAWNEKFSLDPVNDRGFEAIQTELEVSEPPVLVICTAKDLMYRGDVLAWLEKNIYFGFVRIMYRRTGDERPSVEVKEEQLKKVQEEGYEVLRAYDDRLIMRVMYNRQGIDTPTDWLDYAPSKVVSQKGFEEGAESGYIKSITCKPPSIQKGFGLIPIKPLAKATVPEYLRKSADAFEERNAEYGDGYKKFGEVMMGLFPEGIEIKNQKDASRYAILNIMVAKLDRYCKNFNKGGHEDSLIDLSTYSAMLNEVDKE